MSGPSSETRARVRTGLSRLARSGALPVPGSGGGRPAKEAVLTGDLGAVAGPDDSWWPGAGAFMLRESRFKPGARHGGVVLEHVLDVDAPLVPILGKDGGLYGFDGARALFLDTETTGLNGGAGTLAFMIGAGRFEGRAFVLRQYVLRDLDEEHAALTHLSDWLHEARYLVTFNGKSFDVPLLVNRCVLNRLETAWSRRPHLDLLHASRRLWGNDLASVALGELEAHVLGAARTDDIPGFEIPGVYRDFLETRRVAEMERVLHHNRLDVLSMVSLLVRGARVCGGDARDGSESWGVGRSVEAVLGEAEALRHYERALALGPGRVLERRIRLRLSVLLRRMGRHEEMVEHLTVLARSPVDLEAMMHLAKHREHHVKDYEGALALVDEMLTRAGRPPHASRPDADQIRAALRHRRQRLLRKLGRSVDSKRPPPDILT